MPSLADIRGEKRERRISLARKSIEKSLLSSPFNSPAKKRSIKKPSAIASSAAAIIGGGKTSGASSSSSKVWNETWMKMVTETIAKKKLKGDQAFADDFDLIKRLDSVIASTSDSSAPDFTRAGMMINYATVQYTMRCDHLEKAIKKFDIVSEMPEMDDDKSSNGTKSTRSRAANKDGSDFIVKDIDKINDYKPELEFREDPLFNQTSAKFDEGGPKGLLLNHLPVDTSSHIIFDSSRPANMMTAENSQDVGEAAEDISADVMNELKSMLDGTQYGSASVSDLSMFPAIESAKVLDNFIFCGWQPDASLSEGVADENNSLSSGSSSPAFNDMDDDEDAFDLGDNTQWEADFDLDQTHIPAAMTQIQQHHQYPTVPGNGEGPSSIEMVDQATVGTRVLRTRGPAIRIKWDGSSVKGALNDGKKKKERKKREAFSLDFFAEFDRKKAFAKASKKSTTLTDGGRAKDPSQNLLPEDVQFSVEELSAPFTKRGFRIRPYHFASSSNDPGRQGALDDAGHYVCQMEGGAHGLESFNDSIEDDAPDFALADDDDDEVHFGAIGESTGHGDNTTSGEGISFYNATFIRDGDEGSADAASIFSRVSKTRKDVNVRLVKKQIWQELTTPADENTHPENPTLTEQGVTKESSVQGVHSFSGICSELPSKVMHAAKNGTQMAKNLSIPVNFVILLHLANEHQLSIESLQGTLGDLSIKGN